MSNGIFKFFQINMKHLLYIVGYTVGNLVLMWRASEAVKRDLRTYIRRFVPSPNENFEYGYPHSNALLQIHLKLECCKPSSNEMCRN